MGKCYFNEFRFFFSSMNWQIEWACLSPFPLVTAVKWEQDINLTVKCHWRRVREQEGRGSETEPQGAPVFKVREEEKGPPVGGRTRKEEDDLHGMTPGHPGEVGSAVLRANRRSRHIQVETHPLDWATRVTFVTLVRLIMGEISGSYIQPKKNG